MAKSTSRYSFIVVVLLLLATGSVLAGGAVQAEQTIDQHQCTLETIAGTYIFQAQGVVVEDGQTKAYAEAGVWTLDGEGNAEGVISASIDGVPFASKDTFTATYNHEANCVFTAIDAFDLEFDLYTNRWGRTITYFSPGISGTMTRY